MSVKQSYAFLFYSERNDLPDFETFKADLEGFLRDYYPGGDVKLEGCPPRRVPRVAVKGLEGATASEVAIFRALIECDSEDGLSLADLAEAVRPHWPFRNRGDSLPADDPLRQVAHSSLATVLSRMVQRGHVLRPQGLVVRAAGQRFTNNYMISRTGKQFFRRLTGESRRD